MEVTALCFRLLMLGFLLLETPVQSLDTQQRGAASLRIDPDRLQFFVRSSILFQCDGTDGSAQFRRICNATVSTLVCDIESSSSGSSCSIDRAYPSDSGEYWCETEGGQRSNSINITITGGSVILESPALPVMEGDPVTLRCRNKTTSTKAVFYKDNVLMNNSPTQEIRMNKVSNSDEGLYKCSIQGAGESPESRLTVTELHRDTSEDTSRDTRLFSDNFIHVLLLMRTIFTVVLVVLQLLLLGLFYFGKLEHVQKKLNTRNTETS